MPRREQDHAISPAETPPARRSDPLPEDSRHVPCGSLPAGHRPMLRAGIAHLPETRRTEIDGGEIGKKFPFILLASRLIFGYESKNLAHRRDAFRMRSAMWSECGASA